MSRSDIQEIQTRLQAVRETHADLAEVIDLHLDLLEAQAQVEFQPPVPEYTIEAVRDRFAHRTPLLRPQEMVLDWETFAALYEQVCRISKQHRPDLATQFKELSALLESDPDQLRALTTGYLEESRLDPGEQGTKAETTDLLSFVLNHALRPFLQAYTKALTPLVEQDRWQHNRCPLCGGEPDLASLDAEAGARYLVCSRCDGQWLFPRVKCPFCDTTEPHHLSYYPTEDEKYRLYVCQNCQRYLKTIDLRKTGAQTMLTVERITSVELDVAAREKGYW